MGSAAAKFFDDSVSVHNHAVNGRSTKSFIDEGKWNAVLGELKPVATRKALTPRMAANRS